MSPYVKLHNQASQNATKLDPKQGTTLDLAIFFQSLYSTRPYLCSTSNQGIVQFVISEPGVRIHLKDVLHLGVFLFFFLSD